MRETINMAIWYRARAEALERMAQSASSSEEHTHYWEMAQRFHALAKTGERFGADQETRQRE